jgi:aminoglycoside phosphotransferase (APT) family kinase protein
MARWAAEVHVDAALAERLLAAQFPPLPQRSLALLGEGWDYAAFLVDEEWVFRFPRRAVVVPGTEREIATLPSLARLLPVAIPRPEHVGRPSDDYPWPFYGARFLPGAEPGPSLSGHAREAIARPLARTLRALHSAETLAACGGALPFDPMGRGDMAVRVPRTRESLAAIADLWEPPPGTDALFERALELPAPVPRALCHGDLHFRQLLVDGSALTGIVDWVDLCRGDPGIDLLLLYSFLPPEARAVFLAEYGEVDPASLMRARVLAVNLMAVLARYGHDEGMAAVEAEALAGLDRAFA